MENTAHIDKGTWLKKTSISIARSHVPTATYNGKIYGFGGGGPNFKSLNSVIIYDPRNDSWSSGTDMPTLRSGAIALTVGNAIYIVGGGFKQADGTFKFLPTTELYFPETDTWEKGPDMLQPHDYPAGALLDNHIYIMGGHHPDAVVAGPQTDPGFEFCERLNLESNQWEEIAPLPTPRFALDAVVIDNRIVTMGGVAFTPEGFNNFDHTEVFDPATGQWSPGEITLPWTAAGAGACLTNGHMFIFGGYSGDGISDYAACYDIKQKQWHILPPMPHTLAAMGVAVIDNNIFLQGGWADDKREPQDFLWCYTY